MQLAKYFDGRPDEFTGKNLFSQILGPPKNGINYGAVRSNCSNGHLRPLPGILMVRLRNAHLKAIAKTVLQRSYDLPFIFQRLGMADCDFEYQ